MRTVLVVDDEKLVRWSIRQKLEASGYQVLEADTCASAMAQFQENLPDLVTLDVRLPDGSGLKLLMEFKKLAPNTPILMITAYGAVEDAVKALKIGAYDYLEKPVNFDRLLHALQNALEASSLREEVDRAKKEERKTYSLDSIIGVSSHIKGAKELIRKVAVSEANTILIQGESGTGKDLVAKALHYESQRSHNPFMVLNCAAIPEQLLESELFGHERGAFTDAKAMKKGLFELADGGSLFFDEISEMALNLQAKLLRVLEDQTFRRIGGMKAIQVDVRVICASNRDVEKMVAEGKFREDLYYRLSVIPINLAPLRERREDIPVLVDYFVDYFNRRFRKNVMGLTKEASDALLSYNWPGNVRELRNAIERAMILQDRGLLGLDLFPIRIAEFRPKIKTETVGGMRIPEEGINLYDVEKQLIAQALIKSQWNQSKASRLLSVSRDTLRYKIKKYGIRKPPEAKKKPAANPPEAHSQPTV
ncbi:MAG TPA: sigma-54 dependent transcriptional regulator [Acidobacteriota bacterium]|nr:sigma-54 dependent transcriptional regulator [Acidobacteriota bacterium]HRV08005.1 sigma-54 dependent transcriptional regulator [Acidobacteriota bacterium]